MAGGFFDDLSDPWRDSTDSNYSQASQQTPGWQASEPQPPQQPQAPQAPQEPQAPTTSAGSPSPSTAGGGFTGAGSIPNAPQAPAPSGAVQQFQQARGFQTQMDSIKTMTDPAQKSVAMDKLARDVFTSLKGAGHDVKWQGDQLIVDGRPYVFGINNDGYADPQHVAANAAAAPMAGWDATKWQSEGHQTPKYAVGRILSQYPPTVEGLQQAAVEVAKAYPGTTFDGKDKLTIPGVGTIDVLAGASQGGTAWAWQDLAEQGGGAGAGVPSLDAFLSTAGTIGGQSGGGTSLIQQAIAGGGGADVPDYTPTALGPTPDLWDPAAGMDFESLLGRLTPQTALDDPSEQAILDLLANPSGLDDLTLDRMKAASKDEITAQAATDDESLQALANSMGIGDSRWLAAERAQGRFGRDNALAAKNRDLDVQAALQRKSDEKEAASLASSAQVSRASQDAAARSGAVSGALQSKGQELSYAQSQADDTRSREMFNETSRQKAAELGISEQQLHNNYILGAMEDATRRYGISEDVRVSLTQAAQQNAQFAAELAFKFQQLDQQDAQFGANLGLSYAQLQQKDDEFGLDNLWG